jgi:hypothetical protein
VFLHSALFLSFFIEAKNNKIFCLCQILRRVKLKMVIGQNERHFERVKNDIWFAASIAAPIAVQFPL